MIAVMRCNSVPIINALIHREVALDATNYRGQTALSLAQWSDEYTTLLEHAGANRIIHIKKKVFWPFMMSVSSDADDCHENELTSSQTQTQQVDRLPQPSQVGMWRLPQDRLVTFTYEAKFTSIDHVSPS
jgi:hypothetical protein